MPNMTDLPADIASMITNNLVHDPVYLIKYKKIETTVIYDDEGEQEKVVIDHRDYVKLLTFKGGPDDCGKIACSQDAYTNNILSGAYDKDNIFSYINTSPFLPAYVMVYGSDKAPKKLADFLKPWTVIKMNNREDLLIIQECTRYA